MAVPVRKSGDGVVSATGRVLRIQGLRGVRVRAVAAAGGMSVGSVLHHFRSVDQILLAVHEDTQRRYLALRTAAVTSGGDAWARLVAGLKAGLPPYAEGDLIELLFEMHGLARRSPRHAVLLTDLWESELRLYQHTVTEGVQEGLFHVDDVQAASRTLLALEDGLALHLVSKNGSMTGPLALATFVDAAATIVGAPSLASPHGSR